MNVYYQNSAGDRFTLYGDGLTYIDPNGSWSSAYADGTWEYYDSVTGESGGGIVYD